MSGGKGSEMESVSRSEWVTDRTCESGGTPYDAVGVRHDIDMVTVYTDTPEFPGQEDPQSFETINIHLTSKHAQELANAICIAADIIETSFPSQMDGVAVINTAKGSAAEIDVGEWIKGWPKEPGWYWMWKKAAPGKRQRPPVIVRAHSVSSQELWVFDGVSVLKKEAQGGRWFMALALPTPPQ